MDTHDDGRTIESPATTGPLPHITDEAIARIETAVFDEIAGDRRRGAAKTSRRRRTWGGVAAAAAIVVVAAVISPVVLGGLGGSGGADAPGYSVDAESGSDGTIPEGDALSGDRQAGGSEDDAAAAREIIATGSAIVEVDDILVASDQLTALAEDAGGYVERLDAGGTGEGAEPSDGGHVALRVPADALEGLLERLEEVGVVSGSSLSREDVTDQTVDLRARVKATRASVERLTELLSQSGSVGDLIEAETALSERQAELESYQAQLDGLEDRVAMSSLQVDLTLEATAQRTDPANFGDGFVAGWNGLMVTLNGVIVAIGFLLPWIVVLALAGGLVWGIVRLARRRRT